MADNFELAGLTIAAQDATVEGSSAKIQRAKLAFGSAASVSDVSSTNPLPVKALAQLDSSILRDGNNDLTPKFAKIALTATGTLVAAVTAKKIRVVSLMMVLDVLTGDETYTFKSGAAGTALTGALGDASGAGAVMPVEYGFSPFGHFQTVAGALLELSIAGTTPFAQGSLVYVEVS